MENGLIFLAIPKIIGELGPIGKDKENKEQHFKYRSIDQFYNAAAPLFGKHGIFTVPEILKREVREYATKSGNIWQSITLTIQYTIYAGDGSSVKGSVVGAGADPGDKADGKAMAIGHKYFLMQVLCVATEGLDDPDEHTPEGAVETPHKLLYNLMDDAERSATIEQFKVKKFSDIPLIAIEAELKRREIKK